MPDARLRRDEMEDHGGRDARGNGNESAPAPIRENAKGQHCQAGQYRNLDEDRSHRALV
jgi:hypothetical protein